MSRKGDVRDETTTTPCRRPAARDGIDRLLVMAPALVAGGCQKVLFPAKSTRSQFEDYDRMRQIYVPMQVPDMYGKPRPALRERLTTE